MAINLSVEKCGKLLTIDQLRDYRYWIGRSPLEIRQAAIANGGWAKVFPHTTEFPLWASRVRNYFNETPMEIKSLDMLESLKAASRATKIGLLSDVKANCALEGMFVYEDRSGRLWYQMVPVSSIYHYDGEVDTAKKIKGFLMPQVHTPVFKLVSPDGSGGSREVCIHNWQLNRENWNPLTRGAKGIGKTDQWVNIRTKVVIDPVYAGSYNYSETIEMGSSNHEHRDVKPHKVSPSFYVNPSMFSQINSRRFPEKDRSGKAIGPV